MGFACIYNLEGAQQNSYRLEFYLFFPNESKPTLQNSIRFWTDYWSRKHGPILPSLLTEHESIFLKAFGKLYFCQNWFSIRI